MKRIVSQKKLERRSPLLPLPYTFLILTCLLIHDQQVNAGIISAVAMQLGTKSIYLFGDHHTAGKETDQEKQVEEFIEAVKETSTYRKNENLHVLVEEGYERPFYKVPKSMLKNLPEESSQQGATGITFENAEIRQISSSAGDILEAFFPREIFEHEKHYEEGPLLYSLTFHDIIQSYTQWLSYAEEFRASHTHPDKELDAKLFKFFDSTIYSVKVKFRSFLDLMQARNILPATNISYYTRNYWKEHVAKDYELIEENFRLFCSLFDLYLFIRVYTHPGNHIAVVAGAAHIGQIQGMLDDIEALTKYEWCSRDYTELNPELIRLISKYQLLGAFKRGYMTQILKEMCIQTFFRIVFGSLIFLKKIQENHVTTLAFTFSAEEILLYLDLASG